MIKSGYTRISESTISESDQSLLNVLSTVNGFAHIHHIYIVKYLSSHPVTKIQLHLL